PSASSTRMTSLIAANNASSSASASRTTGAADFVVVILRGTNTHPAATSEQLPGAGRDARHPRWPPPVSGGGSPRRRRLVQHRLHELSEVDRLPDIAVRAQPIAQDHVPLLARRGEDDDRQQAGAFVRADAGRLAGAAGRGRAHRSSTSRTLRTIASGVNGFCT